MQVKWLYGLMPKVDFTHWALPKSACGVPTTQSQLLGAVECSGEFESRAVGCFIARVFALQILSLIRSNMRGAAAKPLPLTQANLVT
jgi:hypothetical protein